MDYKNVDNKKIEVFFSAYLDSKRRVALASVSKIIINKHQHKNDLIIVNYIEELLKHLDIDSYRIIYNEYILRLPSKWYLEFYTKSNFYILKNKANEEFIRCLDS